MLQGWKQILLKAWSVRFLALAAFVNAGEQLLPMLQVEVSNTVYVGLNFILIIAAFISRLVNQKSLDGHR